MGKSAITRELEHWLLNRTEDNIGVLALEESVGRTAWGIVSVEANLPLSIREERQNVPKEHIRKWYDATLGTGRIFSLDHFGSTSEETLLSRIRYMVKGLECKWVILDHLSIVVSAMDEGGDERKTIDSIMTKLRQLTEETGAGLILVSHLRRVAGDKGHEQGHEVSLAHLRGSQSIAQLSDAVVALERNQQADSEREANLTTVRVLKNRYAGIVGVATYLYYERETGRLREVRDRNEFLGISLEETGGI
jgi:twinkle protein